MLNMRSKLNKTNESGRSMVEMLGVLAVIGVLSVMGIAGYTQAMKSYKANEIVNATSMLYMLGISANGGQGVTQDLTYSAAFGGTLPDGVSTLTYKTNGSIDLTIADEDIRSRVANILGSKANSTEGSTTLSITMHTGSSSGSSSGTQGGNSGTGTQGTEEPDYMNMPANHECPSGYKEVHGPDYGCAKNQSAANEFCVSLNDIMGMSFVGACDEETYYSCTSNWNNCQ